MKALQAPFPYFGGKSTVAGEVWRRFGVLDNYVEPFFGSGAILLNNPRVCKSETVNDKSGFVANFWRALQHEPDEVAKHATNPVNECDLHARNIYLRNWEQTAEPKLCGDPFWYDAQAAGWWAWGISSSIGSNFANNTGPWQSIDGELVFVDRKTREGVGIKKSIIELHRPKGINKGMFNIRPQSVATSLRTDANPFEPSAKLIDWMNAIALRMRNVRVACGDWSRVTSPTVTHLQGLTGVFLDPPYAHSERETVYSTDEDCEAEVMKYAYENGDNPLMRIALCGYYGKHDIPANWTVFYWTANGGYAKSATRGRVNAKREMILFSPHCVTTNLFDVDYSEID